METFFFFLLNFCKFFVFKTFSFTTKKTFIENLNETKNKTHLKGKLDKVRENLKQLRIINKTLTRYPNNQQSIF